MESDPRPDPKPDPKTDPIGESEAAAENDGPHMGEDHTGVDHTAVDHPDGDDPRDPLRFSNWMKRSATGAVMTGIAFGLKEALQPKHEQAAFVIEAPGEPEDPDKPIDLRFDPDSPADTVAIIRRPGSAEPPGPPAHSA